MSDRSQSYWSIGEVLSLLQDEFPEVTISKIRFLESQGLINPERTPSGYRRFYQSDFDRLQWILTQQRDHYLPLKVIRDRLEAGEWQATTLVAAEASLADPVTGHEDAQMTLLAPVIDIRATEAGARAETQPVVGAPEGEAAEGWTDQAVAGEPSSASQPDASHPESADAVGPSPAQEAMANSEPGVALTLDEIAASSGCDVAMIRDLERFDLISGRAVGPTVLYDSAALTIARHAAQFRTFGLDPRHLRTFQVGAEREVALLAQVVEPLRHRRDPETRRKSVETMDDLLDLGASLRAILMRQITQNQLPPT